MTLPKNKTITVTVAPESKEAPPTKARAVANRAVSAVKPAAARKKAAPVKQAPAAKVDKVVEKAAKKEKYVRASFSMPDAQYVALSELKARCLRLGISAKKGEVLAAGIQLLRNLSEHAFEAAILPCLRTDRKLKNGKMRQK